MEKSKPRVRNWLKCFGLNLNSNLHFCTSFFTRRVTAILSMSVFVLHVNSKCHTWHVYRRTNDWSVTSVLQSVLLCVSSVPHEGGWLDQGVSGGRVGADPPLQEGDVLSLNCHHRTSAASGRPTNLHNNKTYSDNLVRLMHLIMELYWSLYWSALGDIFLCWRQLVNII